jgi:hypothetical protein
LAFYFLRQRQQDFGARHSEQQDGELAATPLAAEAALMERLGGAHVQARHDIWQMASKHIGRDEFEVDAEPQDPRGEDVERLCAERHRARCVRDVHEQSVARSDAPASVERQSERFRERPPVTKSLSSALE